MEKSQRITAQIYGYAICLVAVLTFIFSTMALVNSFFDLGDPIHSGFTQQGSPSLASFENYKMDIMKQAQKGDETAKAIADEQTLKAMYEAAKNDKVQAAKHSAIKTITISSIMILISFILFFTHWRWMKRIARTDL